MSVFKRMKPVITKIQKRSQGNFNHKVWMLARFNQFKQFNVMTGKSISDNLRKEYGIDPIPDYFNPVMLPKITREQIFYFDETYFEQEGGDANCNDVQIQFPRDVNRKYNPISTTLLSESL